MHSGISFSVKDKMLTILVRKLVSKARRVTCCYQKGKGYHVCGIDYHDFGCFESVPCYISIITNHAVSISISQQADITVL